MEKMTKEELMELSIELVSEIQGITKEQADAHKRKEYEKMSYTELDKESDWLWDIANK